MSSVDVAMFGNINIALHFLIGKVKQNRHKRIWRCYRQGTQQIGVSFNEFAVNIHKFTRIVVVIVFDFQIVDFLTLFVFKE